jgi:hypothetical protein
MYNKIQTGIFQSKVSYFPIDNARVIYTKTFNKPKKKKKNDNARYAMKIEKIPNHLQTYVHNNLKQRISQK